jgi:hypothetical protein
MRKNCYAEYAIRLRDQASAIIPGLVPSLSWWVRPHSQRLSAFEHSWGFELFRVIKETFFKFFGASFFCRRSLVLIMRTEALLCRLLALVIMVGAREPWEGGDDVCKRHIPEARREARKLVFVL